MVRAIFGGTLLKFLHLFTWLYSPFQAKNVLLNGTTDVAKISLWQRQSACVGMIGCCRWASVHVVIEESSPDSGCRVKHLLWRNDYEETSYVLSGRCTGPGCCPPGESRRHQARSGRPLQGLRYMAQPGY